MSKEVKWMSDRMMFSENLNRAQPYDPHGEGDYIGQDRRVQTYLHLGPDVGETECYVLMASDTVDGEKVVSVSRLRLREADSTEDLRASLSHIISRGKCEFLYYHCNKYGDEDSPVVASTLSIGTNKQVSHRIVMGWVQDDRVDEFSIRFSDGRSVTLDVPEHRYFLGVLDRWPIGDRGSYRPVPEIKEIVARDASGQVIR